MTARRLLVALAAAVAVLGASSAVFAAWNSSGSGGAAVGSAGVSAPTKPTAGVVGRSVNLSWPAVTMPGGVPASSYVVRRVTNAQSAVTVASCTGTATSCVDSALAAGTSTYTVTAKYATWTSTASAGTDAVVSAPVLTLPASTSTLPATLNGTLANALPGSTLSFRLDNATTGTVLSGTPATVPTGASTAVSVTLPAGTATGAHTVYAIAGTEQATAPVSVITNGSPSALTWVTNKDGRARAADQIRVTFTQPLDLAALAPSDPDGNVNVVVTISDNSATSGNDLLTVAGSTGQTVNFGSIDLGSKSFVAATNTFGASGTVSTLVWDATNKWLTLTLGNQSGSSSTVSSNVTAVYTPGAALRTASGGTVTGTASVTARAF